MTIKTTKLSGTDWVDGDILYAADTNDTIETSAEVPDEVYTGNGFDCSGGGTNNTTLTVGAGIISRYVKMSFIVYCETTSTVANSGTVQLTIETSEAGAASWTSRFNRNIQYSVSGSTQGLSALQSFVFYYAPTSDEKTNGLDIKITGTSTTGGGTTGSLTNVQTVIYAM